MHRAPEHGHPVIADSTLPAISSWFASRGFAIGVSADRLRRGLDGRVVDAGDSPTAESDLAVYRAAFNLPPCTTANGCFRKTNQSGSTERCRRRCRLAARSPSTSRWCRPSALPVTSYSLKPTRRIPATRGRCRHGRSARAVAVSNSYYTPEYAGQPADEVHYNHPGVAITVSSGDTGFGRHVPGQFSTSPPSAGLTRARRDPRLTETVWSATGSGCSAYVAKPAWRKIRLCERTLADVRPWAIRIPRRHLRDDGAERSRGWGVYGGTSVGAPIVAAAHALAGAARDHASPGFAYANPGAFYPVLIGKNGSCSPSYLCTAGPVQRPWRIGTRTEPGL